MKAIQKTNKHMMEEIGKTSQKRDREGPRGPKGKVYRLDRKTLGTF